MRSHLDTTLIYEDVEEAYYTEEEDAYLEYLAYDEEPFVAFDEEFAEDFDEFEDEVEIEDDYEDAPVYAHELPVWDKRYLIVVVLVIIFLGAGAAATNNGNHNPVSAANAGQQTTSDLGGRPSSLHVNNPTAVVAPYKDYTLTQGLHGQSYGHLAIDLAAGRGEPVLSPINGFVTDYYIDEYNNTTLVIENENYQVTMLHGDFSVSLGAELSAGQAVGAEGNNGYTMDFFGNLCYGRPHCGNHTHLNVFDKRIQANVNPLDLMR